MPRLGIITNPRSRRHLDGVAGLGEAATGLLHAVPKDRPALRAALADFAAQGVEILVVDGGDGTLREVLTALPEAWPGPPPGIAPLAAGRTNLAARTIGQRGRGVVALRELVDAATAGRLRRHARRVIQVTRLGGDPAPLRGLLFGAAAFTQATATSNEAGQQRRLKDNAIVAITALRTALQTVTGRGEGGRALRQGTPMRLAFDDGPAQDHARFILLATTLDELMFGLWPFWGEGEGALRWLDVAAPPQRVMTGLWSLLRRRAPGIPGWESGRAGTIHVEMTAAFVLDGEAFESGPDGILVGASAPLIFVAP